MMQIETPITEISNERVAELCDRLLKAGKLPSVELLQSCFADTITAAEIDEHLQHWQQTLPGRVLLRDQEASVPDVLQQAVKSLWENALFQASQQVVVEQQQSKSSMEILKDASDEMLVSSRADYEHLEKRYQAQQDHNEELENQIKLLQAEIKVLNNSVQDEIKLRKQAEARMEDAQQQVRRMQKSIEDTKATFDGRLKDEQAHAQEQLSRMDSEASHYRQSLERVRDEAGKKESALTKNIHDLQAELARKDVKIDTLQGQTKSIEAELRTLRTDSGVQGRQLAGVNAKLLSESNKVKRLEDRIKQLETELRQEQQRNKQSGTDAMHKEAELRKELQIKEDELIKTRTTVNSLQKKQVTYEEQIRRLQAQLKR